jgi:hypothetical protein
MKLYPIDKLTTEEADAIALVVFEDLKETGDIEGLKKFQELIDAEMRRRGFGDD